MRALQVPVVVDHFHIPGGAGLCVESHRDVTCWRHNTIQHRAKGIWEVVFTPSLALLQFADGGRVLMRPAVVDDFGNLAFVGAPE